MYVCKGLKIKTNFLATEEQTLHSTITVDSVYRSTNYSSIRLIEPLFRGPNLYKALVQS